MTSAPIHGTGDGSLSHNLLAPVQPIRPIFDVIIIEKQASIKSLIHQNTPRACALGVPQSLPRARGKGALALPVAEKARAPFPQRSKIPRISASPTGFSGTARWTGGPLCVPCGYAVDEVPAKRILDSVVPCQVRQKLRPIVFPDKTKGTSPCLSLCPHSTTAFSSGSKTSARAIEDCFSTQYALWDTTL